MCGVDYARGVVSAEMLLYPCGRGVQEGMIGFCTVRSEGVKEALSGTCNLQIMKIDSLALYDKCSMSLLNISLHLRVSPSLPVQLNNPDWKPLF